MAAAPGVLSGPGGKPGGQRPRRHHHLTPVRRQPPFSWWHQHADRRHRQGLQQAGPPADHGGGGGRGRKTLPKLQAAQDGRIQTVRFQQLAPGQGVTKTQRQGEPVSAKGWRRLPGAAADPHGPRLQSMPLTGAPEQPQTARVMKAQPTDGPCRSGLQLQIVANGLAAPADRGLGLPQHLGRCRGGSTELEHIQQLDRLQHRRDGIAIAELLRDGGQRGSGAERRLSDPSLHPRERIHPVFHAKEQTTAAQAKAAEESPLLLRRKRF